MKNNNSKIATIRAGVRKTESTGNTDRRIEKTKGAGQVCGASGRAFSVPKMQAMLLRFEEIANHGGTQFRRYGLFYRLLNGPRRSA